MRCGFCGQEFRPAARGCPEHRDLVMPWDDLDLDLVLGHEVVIASGPIAPIATLDRKGQLIIVSAWCSGCMSMVHPNEEGSCACGEALVDEVFRRQWWWLQTA